MLGNSCVGYHGFILRKNSVRDSKRNALLAASPYLLTPGQGSALSHGSVRTCLVRHFGLHRML